MAPLRGTKRKRRDKARNRKTQPDPLASLLLLPDSADADWWDTFSRRISVTLSIPIEKLEFESVMKMPRRTFNYICSLVKDILMTKNSQYLFVDGSAMAVEDQVAVALRRLSSGDSLVNVGTAFGTNHSTVSQVTWRFVEAMEERGLSHLRWPDADEMEKIKAKNEKIKGLPNCCGAIDTTHIMLCLPSGEPNSKVWLDSEKNHSMVIQVIVDPDMRFRDIITGWPGSMNELQILKSSGFYKLCEKGARLNGKSVKLSDCSEIREYIVGDNGYPLLPWLMTPYQGTDNAVHKSGFNKRHSATRSVASRALARFKDMWRFFQGEMWRPDKHRLPRMILACGLLHNIMIDFEDDERGEAMMMHSSCLHDGNYKPQVCGVADESGVAVRDALSQYLADKSGPA
ncbi:PIF / Ping-Pong family of plant transposase [Rhynchospora pubera]|uniref:PIF / Ping-Pong family of plant transposase n=1 Tax=Rhynchospora pubera TaxID=906938 RepID=A0AAV8EI42_9POAL|nr:PIF / Ping-Pong family of plant transposase [Rhynchospora pubera]KAJ4779860.1 PIF / Ping-Pong family of plant transposase [Rhynchospora pubera]KAJ4807605.1 PIF / Ping-Pong family of plant transposase [Rhynchospora pubera]